LIANRAAAKLSMENYRSRFLAGRSPDEVAEQTQAVYEEALAERRGG
jgi:hypothetical protein